MELPNKLEESYPLTIHSVATKCNELIDYLELHPRSEEVKSWAYTFLGDTANIRCDENIKTVMVFRGDESYQFTLPESI